MEQTQITDLTVIEKNENFIQLRTGAEKAFAWAEKLAVKTGEDLDSASEHILNFKEGLKMAEATRRFFTDPLNEHVKRINSVFKPHASRLEEAIRTTNTKMVTFHNEQERIAEEARKKTLAQVESGKLTIEQGAKKLEKVAEPEKTTRTESGAAATFVTRKVPVITDLDKIPRRYLLPDMKLIETDLKKGVRIPGAELKEEKTVASRRSIPF